MKGQMNLLLEKLTDSQYCAKALSTLIIVLFCIIESPIFLFYSKNCKCYRKMFVWRKESNILHNILLFILKSKEICPVLLQKKKQVSHSDCPEEPWRILQDSSEKPNS